VAALRQAEPTARAVLLFGSYAHGTQGPFSDLDLCIVTAEPPAVADRLRLLPLRDSLLPVSVHARCLADIAAEAADPDAWPEVRDIYAPALVLSGLDAVLAEIQACIDEHRPAADALWRTASTTSCRCSKPSARPRTLRRALRQPHSSQPLPAWLYAPPVCCVR
jgi:predicted nucleotidyltransferase